MSRNPNRMMLLLREDEAVWARTERRHIYSPPKTVYRKIGNTMAVAKKAETRTASAKELVAATRAGGITLVLGAGVSMPRGIPSWNALAETIWNDVFSGRPSPWDLAKQGGSPQAL